MEKFKALGLSENLLKAIKEMHFKKPTEIQEKAIPLALQGKDIIGGSATGSGKTLAFGATILENVKKGEGIQALIMTPTRELAEQISSALKEFSKYLHSNIVSVYGGRDIEKQTRQLGTADIVVGTPGRLLDHIGRRTLNLTNVKYLVLDEVDRMFDMGFQEDVERILEECPKERQTFLFSATISSGIDYLAHKHTKNPVEIAVESFIDPAHLKQSYYDVPSNLKFSLLVKLLKDEKADLIMVFSNTRRNADFIGNNLKLQGINSQVIHGGLTQNRRNKNLENFNNGKVNVLVCTDVAARGLDIKGVSHVYNFDTPKDSKDYIHRIGRTARAGENGIAISLISDRDYENFQKVNQIDGLVIKRLELPYIQRIEIQTNFSRRGRPEERDKKHTYGGFGRTNRENSRRDKPQRNNRPQSRGPVKKGQGYGRRVDSLDRRTTSKKSNSDESFRNSRDYRKSDQRRGRR